VFGFKCEIRSEVGVREIFKTVSVFSFWKWLIIVVVGLTSFFIGVWRWRYIIRILTGKNIGLKLAIYAKAIGWTIAYITPIAYIGGEPHKVYLLKEEADIDWESAGASVIIDEVLELSMALLFLIAGAVFLFVKFSVPAILFVVLGSSIGTLVVLWLIFWRQTKNGRGFLSFLIGLLNLNKIKWVNGIQEKIKAAEKQTANFFKNHKKQFFAALSLAFLERAALITTFWLMVEFLGERTNIFQIMAVMALTVAVNFLPLPASLGGQEASQTIVFDLFGMGAVTGLVFSLILRILCVGGVLIGLIFLLSFEFKIIKQKTVAFGERIFNFFDRFS
jgi:uncharacterized protein (TIRG00374 family)